MNNFIQRDIVPQISDWVNVEKEEKPVKVVQINFQSNIFFGHQLFDKNLEEGKTLFEGTFHLYKIIGIISDDNQLNEDYILAALT